MPLLEEKSVDGYACEASSDVPQSMLPYDYYSKDQGQPLDRTGVLLCVKNPGYTVCSISGILAIYAHHLLLPVSLSLNCVQLLCPLGLESSHPRKHPAPNI